jgi:hypothetical protein
MIDCPIIIQTQAMDDKKYEQLTQEKYINIQKMFKTLQDTEYTFEQKLSKIARQIEEFNDAMTNKQDQFDNQLSNTTEKETKIFQKNVQTTYTTVAKETKQQFTKLSGDIKTQVDHSIETFHTRLLSNLVQNGVNSMEATLKQYDTKMTARVQQSEAIVEKATDTAIQEIYTISEKAVKTVTDQVQHTLTQTIPAKPTETRPHHATHHFPQAYEKLQCSNTSIHSPQKLNYSTNHGDTSTMYPDVQTPNRDDTDNASGPLLGHEHCTISTSITPRHGCRR